MTLRSDYARIMASSSSYGRNAAIFGREQDRRKIVVAGSMLSFRRDAPRVHVGDARILAFNPALGRALANRVAAETPQINMSGLTKIAQRFTGEEVQAVSAAKALKEDIAPDVTLSHTADYTIAATANGATVDVSLTNSTRDVELLNVLVDAALASGWYVSSFSIGLELERVKQGEQALVLWAAQLNRQLAQPKSKILERQDNINLECTNRTGAPAYFPGATWTCRYLTNPC